MTVASMLLALLAAANLEVAARVAHERLAADAGQLWGFRIDGVPWMGVENGKALLTVQADGCTPAAAGLFSCKAPGGIPPANTSVDWQGRRWAMVMLPLPDDTNDAARLLIHEAFHAVQPALPAYDESGPSAAILEGATGRSSMRLERRALARALESQGPERRAAIADALGFRRQRLKHSRDEQDRERFLEVKEGMPEYTALILTGVPAAEVARRVRAETSESFSRSFAYATGPAWAYLLEDLAPGWRARLAQTNDLQWLMPVAAAAAPRDLYEADSVHAEEEAQQVVKEKELRRLRARFVEAPLLRIRPAGLNISFDYRGQRSLGTHGNVMPMLVWKDAGGSEVSAPDGGLVTIDFSEIRLPLDGNSLPPGPLKQPVELRGSGWTLKLAAGWYITRNGRSLLARPPKRQE